MPSFVGLTSVCMLGGTTGCSRFVEVDKIPLQDVAALDSEKVETSGVQFFSNGPHSFGTLDPRLEVEKTAEVERRSVGVYIAAVPPSLCRPSSPSSFSFRSE